MLISSFPKIQIVQFSENYVFTFWYILDVYLEREKKN